MRAFAAISVAMLMGAGGLGCATGRGAAAPTKGAPVSASSEAAKGDTGKVVHEVTIGVPVPDLDAAVAWYTQLLGRDVQSVEPVDGVVELKVATGAWLQLFTVDDRQFRPSTSVLRFKTSDIDAEAARLSQVGIQSGEIVRVPDVVEFAEFVDPYGNPLSLYEVQ